MPSMGVDEIAVCICVYWIRWDVLLNMFFHCIIPKNGGTLIFPMGFPSSFSMGFPVFGCVLRCKKPSADHPKTEKMQGDIDTGTPPVSQQ